MSNQISLGPRRDGHRTPARRMVIVVEGRSEKIYFERFRTRERPISIRIHESKDHTAKGMIKKCISLIERSGLDREAGDVIAVFDTDRNTEEELREAMGLASEYGIDVYVSNPSFEFWLLLHFEDNKTAYVQDVIEELLGKHLGFRYKKPESVNKHIDDENVKKAVIRSKRLLADANPMTCKNNSPSTCLHLLVERLMK